MAADKAAKLPQEGQFSIVGMGHFYIVANKEAERAKHRGKDTRKLRAVISLLLHRRPLPQALNDHPLKGKFKGYRDLHLEPDWILIYKADAENVWLARTGTHADLFNA